MKKIECYIRPEKLEQVKKGLFDIGIHGMTIYEVKGHGTQRGIKLMGRAGQYCVEWIDKLKLEMVLNRDQDLNKVIDIIIKNAITGHPGDGKIFVTPVEEAIRIRTGERGEIII
ncbi:MAG: P-II family nitrogen regulator [Candidatus Helarchaeota archaeon]|nr:P-II family nitrogen regulator [Candidatus Helarchaeota archaeon]